MKLAICDDDRNFCLELQEKIINMAEFEITKINTFVNPNEMLTNVGEYNIIFLDIEMPLLSGFEVAGQINESNPLIVFVTSHEDFVFNAINNYHSFGFVRKRCLNDDLKSILEKVEKKNQFTNFILVKRRQDTVKIFYSDIYYLEKMKNSVIIHSRTGEYTQRKSLSEYEIILGDFGFVRCHAGYIVNLDYIFKIDSNKIVLSNYLEVPVSRSKVSYVKEEFMKRDVIF